MSKTQINSSDIKSPYNSNVVLGTGINIVMQQSGTSDIGSLAFPLNAIYTNSINIGTGLAAQFVNVTGSTMTGSLTMSAANLLAAQSGNNIGSVPTPFQNAYINNLVSNSLVPFSTGTAGNIGSAADPYNIIYANEVVTLGTGGSYVHITGDQMTGNLTMGSGTEIVFLPGSIGLQATSSLLNINGGAAGISIDGGGGGIAMYGESVGITINGQGGAIHLTGSQVIDMFSNGGLFNITSSGTINLSAITTANIGGSNWLNLHGGTNGVNIQGGFLNGIILDSFSEGVIYASGTNLYPASSGLQNIGSAALPFGTIYVGNIVETNPTGDGVFVHITGDTMLGNLTMSGSSILIGGASTLTSTNSLAIGVNAQASGAYSIAAGLRSYTFAPNSYAFGADNIASGNFAFVGGSGSKALGDRSVAIGYKNLATGTTSTAFGSSNHAYGLSSFVANEFNSAIGSWSSAFGSFNSATGESSFVIGEENTANGALSFAGGTNTATYGDYSLSFGASTISSGNNSVTIGKNITALNSGTFVFGMGAPFTTYTGTASNALYLVFSNGVVLSSGTNLTAETSGTQNVGSLASPFQKVYANTFIQSLTTITGLSYTASSGSSVVLVNSTGTATIGLPIFESGYSIVFKDKSGSANMTTNKIAITGIGCTLDGSAEYDINSNYGRLQFISDGSNWYRVE